MKCTSSHNVFFFLIIDKVWQWDLFFLIFVIFSNNSSYSLFCMLLFPLLRTEFIIKDYFLERNPMGIQYKSDALEDVL